MKNLHNRVEVSFKFFKTYELSHHRTYHSVYGGCQLNNYVLLGSGLLVISDLLILESFP